MADQTEEGVSPSVQKAFASMLGDGDEDEGDEDQDDDDTKMDWKDIGEEGDDDNDDDDDDEEDNDGNDVTPGDAFALEMELNRENKKMMRVQWFITFLAAINHSSVNYYLYCMLNLIELSFKYY